VRFSILLSIFLLSSPCYAAIYMQKDSNGNITYSDTPLENAQIVETPEPKETSTSVQRSPITNIDEKNIGESETTPAQEVRALYTTFDIISPKDQENIQNQPTLPVDIKLEPELKSGDKIQLLLDNKIIGNASTSTHIMLGQLERGTHQLSAIILDSNQKVVQKSTPITIYVNRVNANFKPGGNAAANSTSTTLLSQVQTNPPGKNNVFSLFSK
jgi:hypothetical protein